MMHFVAVGACYLDTVLSVPYYPSEDEKLRASSLIRRRGGNCPNTLEVLGQLLETHGADELSTALCAVFPSEDSQASMEIKSSIGPKVSFGPCIHREDQTEPASSYIIRNLATDSRTIVNYNALQEMTLEEFVAGVKTYEQEETFFHFEGRIPDVTLACMWHIRRTFSSARISVEVEKPNRSGLKELAAEADVVIYSRSYAQSCGFDDPKKFLTEQVARTPKASCLCCTWGQQGASMLSLTTMEYQHVESYRSSSSRVTDTIGAGDTFIAGVLYGMLCNRRWSCKRVLEFANELASRKVYQEGFHGLGKLMAPKLAE